MNNARLGVAAQAVGIAEAAIDAAVHYSRERNQIRIRLLTLLANYLATESCDDITRTAIQVHGGLGFMAESTPGKLHNDGIITTIYEGTSEIQVSFALREVGKGALIVAFDGVRRDLDRLERADLSDLAARVRTRIDQALGAGEELGRDVGYALLSSQSLAEILISAIVSAELLLQADVDPARTDTAASWVDRRMVDLEGRVERILGGSSDLIARCQRMIEAAVPSA